MNKYHKEADKLIRESVETLTKILGTDGEDVSYYYEGILNGPITKLVMARSEMAKASIVSDEKGEYILNEAQNSLKMGEEYPYDGSGKCKDWAHLASRGILADLQNRKGIKHELRNVGEQIRKEIVCAMSDIIREAHKQIYLTDSSKPTVPPDSD